MPYIKRDQYDELLTAGNALSNLAFNFSQGARLQEGDRTVLKRWQRNWDKAKTGIPGYSKKSRTSSCP